MRFMQILAVAAALSPLALAAHAATVHLALNSTVGKNVKIHHPDAVTSRVKASSFHMTGSDGIGKFVAFCVDIAHKLTLPATYEIVGANQTTAALQNLFDANYADVDTANANQSAAFQLAIWDTLYDKFSWSNSTSAVDTMTSRYLANASAYIGPKTWYLTFLDGDKTQDVVTVDMPAPVPLPAAGFLLLGGLGGLGIFACRRRTA